MYLHKKKICNLNLKSFKFLLDRQKNEISFVARTNMSYCQSRDLFSLKKKTMDLQKPL